jgi:hypothetical protein
MWISIQSCILPIALINAPFFSVSRFDVSHSINIKTIERVTNLIMDDKFFERFGTIDSLVLKFAFYKYFVLRYLNASQGLQTFVTVCGIVQAAKKH